MAELICPARWEKLLVCTDGSPNSMVAVDETLALARACGSKVSALQVLQIIPEFEAQAPDLRIRLEEEIAAHLEAIKSKAERLQVAIDTRIRHSVSPFSAILEEAEKIRPDLIIMGRYGHTGLVRLLMGSVTARVIGYSPFNVLVIPQRAALRFGRLLVASDGSPFSAAAWDEALALAQQANSALFGIAVAREEGEIAETEEISRRMLIAANQAGLAFTGLTPQGQQPDDAIVQAALKHNIDVIVMGSHGRTGLKRLLMGSITERVIGQSPCPVLVVKKTET